MRKILRFSVNMVFLVNFKDIENEDGVVSFLALKNGKKNEQKITKRLKR